jgi:hypothetical protein
VKPVTSVAGPLDFFPTSVGHDPRALPALADRIPHVARHVPILADACTLRCTHVLEHPAPVARCVRAVAFVVRAADSNATCNLLRGDALSFARMAVDCRVTLASFLVTSPSFHATRVSPKDTRAARKDAVASNRNQLVPWKDMGASFSNLRVSLADTVASFEDTRPSWKDTPPLPTSLPPTA